MFLSQFDTNLAQIPNTKLKLKSDANLSLLFSAQFNCRRGEDAVRVYTMNKKWGKMILSVKTCATCGHHHQNQKMHVFFCIDWIDGYAFRKH